MSKPGVYKIREENELRIPDRGDALSILEALGVRLGVRELDDWHAVAREQPVRLVLRLCALSCRECA